MPALPISPDEQSEADCVALIASTVSARGRYSEPLARALRSLNAVCAKLFHRDPVDEADEPGPRGAA